MRTGASTSPFAGRPGSGNRVVRERGSAYIQLYMGRLEDSARRCERVDVTATARENGNALLFLWMCLATGVARGRHSRSLQAL